MMDARTEVVALLLHPGTRIDDPQDPSTWLVAGEPPTPLQVALMRRLSADALRDVTTLLRLDLELLRRERWQLRTRELCADVRQLLHDLDAPDAVD